MSDASDVRIKIPRTDQKQVQDSCRNYKESHRESVL